MKFVVRQKILAFGDNFIIRDEAENDCYMVKGRVFAFGDKLKIFDMQGQELVYIEQKLFRFLPEYNIYYKGQLEAVVKKEFTFFKPRFNIHSNRGSYTVEGNIWAMDFTILKEGAYVAQVSKRWFSWADTYGIDIADGEDHPFMLAMVIVIDQVLHDKRHNNH